MPSTTTTNWISSGYLNLKISLEDILQENLGYLMAMFYDDMLGGAGSQQMPDMKLK
jgi:hypothetical protein